MKNLTKRKISLITLIAALAIIALYMLSRFALNKVGFFDGHLEITSSFPYRTLIIGLILTQVIFLFAPSVLSFLAIKSIVRASAQSGGEVCVVNGFAMNWYQLMMMAFCILFVLLSIFAPSSDFAVSSALIFLMFPILTTFANSQKSGRVVHSQGNDWLLSECGYPALEHFNHKIVNVTIRRFEDSDFGEVDISLESDKFRGNHVYFDTNKKNNDFFKKLEQRFAEIRTTESFS